MRVGELLGKFPYDPSKPFAQKDGGIACITVVALDDPHHIKKAQRKLCAFLYVKIRSLDLFQDDLFSVKDHANGIAWLQF